MWRPTWAAIAAHANRSPARSTRSFHPHRPGSKAENNAMPVFVSGQKLGTDTLLGVQAKPRRSNNSSGSLEAGFDLLSYSLHMLGGDVRHGFPTI